MRYVWNFRLLWSSVAGVGLLVLIGMILFHFGSSRTPETLLCLAENAEKEGRFHDQVDWLNCYSLGNPHDVEAIVNTAVAANEAVNRVPPAEVRDATNNARKHLGIAIARLANDRPDQSALLRKMLIVRLLELKGPWLREAQRQIILLNPPPGDPLVTKWMALSRIGQIDRAAHLQTSANSLREHFEYWHSFEDLQAGAILLNSIELFPSDIDLLANAVELLIERPESFDVSGVAHEAGRSALKQRIAQKITALNGNAASRPRLLLLKLESTPDPGRNWTSESKQRWVQYATEATQRLAKLVDPPANKMVFESPQVLPIIDHCSPEFWDIRLVAEVANKLIPVDPVLANEYFMLLTKLPLGWAPNLMIEDAYLQAGQLALSQNNFATALTIWQEGLSRVNSTNLDLLGAVAALQSQICFETCFKGESDPALEKQKADTSIHTLQMTLGQLRTAIDTVSRQLTSSTIDALPRDERTSLRRKIETAGYRYTVLDAAIGVQTNRTHQAIQQLDSVVLSQADIDNACRLKVARWLVRLYEQERIWDCAATTLEKTIELHPELLELRVRAAQAWEKTGNQSRAIEQWRILANSDQPALQVASLWVRFEHEKNRVPSQRDFHRIRLELEGVAKYLQASINGASHQDVQADLARNMRQLELLAVCLPDQGEGIVSHLASPSTARSLEQLAESYPRDSKIQMFVAEQLAAIGCLEGAAIALQRLRDSRHTSADFAVALARIAFNRDEYRSACQQLLNEANQNSRRGNELRYLAADLAERAGDYQMVYEALVSIPANERSLYGIFKIAESLTHIPDSSAIRRASSGFEQDPVGPERVAESHWIAELQLREGESGSFGDFLLVARQIAELQTRSEEIASNDPLLTLARQALRELTDDRPAWGAVISLEGCLAAIEGNSAEAVRVLRRGIASGDRRTSTKKLLNDQLERLSQHSVSTPRLIR